MTPSPIFNHLLFPYFIAISLAINMGGSGFGLSFSVAYGANIIKRTAPALYYNTLNISKLFIDIIPTWFVLPLVSFAVCFLIGKYIYNPIRRRGYLMSPKTHNHPILKYLVIGMALYVAFSIGANNVAMVPGQLPR